jgi:hypothetical protein
LMISTHTSWATRARADWPPVAAFSQLFSSFAFVLELSVGWALTAPLQAVTACLSEILLGGRGTAFGTIFVPVVGGAVVVGRGVLLVEDVVVGLVGAVAGRVAVDGNVVVLVGAPAVLVGVLERSVDAVLLVAVDPLLLPQPLTSAPPASATTSHVDNLGNLIPPS